MHPIKRDKKLFSVDDETDIDLLNTIETRRIQRDVQSSRQIREKSIIDKYKQHEKKYDDYLRKLNKLKDDQGQRLLRRQSSRCITPVKTPKSNRPITPKKLPKPQIMTNNDYAYMDNMIRHSNAKIQPNVVVHEDIGVEHTMVDLVSRIDNGNVAIYNHRRTPELTFERRDISRSSSWIKRLRSNNRVDDHAEAMPSLSDRNNRTGGNTKTMVAYNTYFGDEEIPSIYNHVDIDPVNTDGMMRFRSDDMPKPQPRGKWGLSPKPRLTPSFIAKRNKENDERKNMARLNPDMPDDMDLDNYTTSNDSNQFDNRYRDKYNDIDSYITKLQSFLKHRISGVPQTSYDEIHGYNNLKTTLKSIQSVIHYKKELNVESQPLECILLHGPPGKSALALSQAFANSLNTKFMHMKTDTLANYKIDITTKLRLIIDIAIQNSPITVFLESIENLFPQQNSSKDIYNDICEFIKKINETDQGIDLVSFKIILIATAVKPWEIDKGLLQVFNKKVFVPFPDFRLRFTILESLHDNKNILAKENIEFLAMATENYTESDLDSISDELRARSVTNLSHVNKILSYSNKNSFLNDKDQKPYKVISREVCIEVLDQIRPNCDVPSAKTYERWSAFQSI